MSIFTFFRKAFDFFWDVGPLAHESVDQIEKEQHYWVIRFFQMTLVANLLIFITSIGAFFLTGVPFALLFIILVLLSILVLFFALWSAKRGKLITAGIAFFWMSISGGVIGVLLVPKALPVALLTVPMAIAGSLPCVKIQQLRWMIPATILMVPLHMFLSFSGPLLPISLTISPLWTVLAALQCLGITLFWLWQYHMRNFQIQSILEMRVQERTAALHDRELMFRAVTEMTSDYIFVLDTGDSPTAYSQLIHILRTISSYPVEPGSDEATVLAFIHENDRGAVQRFIRIRDKLQEPMLEFRVLQAEGEPHWLRCYLRVQESHELGSALRIIGALQDITATKAYEWQISQLAFFDPLTGLPNRRLFNERMNDCLRTISVTNPLTILFMDLDRFKTINDTLGHEVGDMLLKQVALRLQDRLRSSDLLVRLGGDEFAVLLPNTSLEAAATVTLNLLQQFEQAFLISEHQLRVSVSIGIASAPEHGMHMSILLQHADIAMYQAKYQGSQFEIYRDDMFSYSQERLQLEHELLQALERQELLVYYQPILDIAKGRTSHLEALVRWQHPRQGLIMPADFIPLAEECGFIAALDQWVLCEVLGFIAQLQSIGLHYQIGVNLSAQSLQNRETFAFVQDCLAETHANPAMLLIEVMESTLMKDLDQTQHILQQFKELGMTVALDDFGSGHASMQWLKELPVGMLKVDRAFMRGINNNTKDEGIMRAFLALAHGLDLSIVAEGVETLEQLHWLHETGFDYGQGFYMSYPIPASEILSYLITEERDCASFL